MKRLIFRFLTIAWILQSTLVFSQSDTITQIQYDTVVVNNPVTVTKRVLYLGPRKQKLSKKTWIGISAGLNSSYSLYTTCKECEDYQPYAHRIDSSQKDRAGVNVTGHVYRILKKKLYLESGLRYRKYIERFSVGENRSINRYQLLGISISTLYEIAESEQHKLLVGIGINGQYLQSAYGKTIAIFQEEQIVDINSFRKFNKFLGGAQVSTHWIKKLYKNFDLLINPELMFEITSLTSYKEYYLQNRFCYSINGGVLYKL